MGFNENAFMIAGTAIAMFGVGLYIWDTRKESVANTYKSYSTGYGSSNTNNVVNNKVQTPDNYGDRETFSDNTQAQAAGSKRRKRRNKKTKKRHIRKV